MFIVYAFPLMIVAALLSRLDASFITSALLMASAVFAVHSAVLLWRNMKDFSKYKAEFNDDDI